MCQAGTRAAVIALTAASMLRLSVSAAPPPDLTTLLSEVGARVANYYHRAENVICTETSTVQPIDRDWSWQGSARTVESELRMEMDAVDGDGAPEARLVRDIQRVNGRPPKPRDEKGRAGCMDPDPLSPEPLAFLLPPQRGDYRFTGVHAGHDGARAAFIIDFASADRTSRPELVEDPRGHEDCFDWTGPIAVRGQVWVDAQSYDVLRVDRRLFGPVDVRVPVRLQRRYNFAPYVVLDRDDQSLHYRTVAFTNPDEVALLPDAIDSTTILRTGLQSIRRTAKFSGYRRFLTDGHIKGR